MLDNQSSHLHEYKHTLSHTPFTQNISLHISFTQNISLHISFTQKHLSPHFIYTKHLSPHCVLATGNNTRTLPHCPKVRRFLLCEDAINNNTHTLLGVCGVRSAKLTACLPEASKVGLVSKIARRARSKSLRCGQLERLKHKGLYRNLFYESKCNSSINWTMVGGLEKVVKCPQPDENSYVKVCSSMARNGHGRQAPNSSVTQRWRVLMSIDFRVHAKARM